MKKLNRKSLTAIIIGVVVIIALVITAVVFLVPQKFTLSNEYYNNANTNTVDEAGLEKLISEKKSFVLLIWQPGCETSTAFEKVVEDFSETHQIGFEKIKYSEAKKSGLVGDLRFYPSLAIYQNGVLKTFLDAESDADLPYYKSQEKLAEWLERYVRV